ncbi:MAG: four helix bundle protein [Trueperaceae bacterium]|nr:MAG: four helix bundle protein [Trueperaceae bacterium]
MHQAESRQSRHVNRGSEIENRTSNTFTHTIPESPNGFRAGPFDHERLEAFQVARQALARGDHIARGLPRGFGSLKDQLRRALLSAYLGVAEAANRTGKDRLARFRWARAEAAEAAAALDAILILKLATAGEIHEVIHLLARLAAMLTKLGRLNNT